MRVLYMDVYSGIAGDMMLAALVHLGLPFEYLKENLDRLNLAGYELEYGAVEKNHIAAGKIDVHVSERHVHRHLKDILEIIEKAGYNQTVKSISEAVFRKIAEAEARIHNTTPDKIHFHEVGAVDAIVDIVGTAIGIDYFKPDYIIASPVPLSRGVIRAAHGILPVPAPATMEILKGIAVEHIDGEGERVTPTGAAILTTLRAMYGYPGQPSYRIDNISYGAGTKDFPDRTNLLRLVLGHLDESASVPTDEVEILETNIDDMIPQTYGYLLDRLYQEGASEVYITPVYMKKNRPGQLLTVICKKDLVSKLSDIIFYETTTAGIRYRTMNRRILERRVVRVDTPYGPVGVKILKFGNRIKLQPEYEDCKKAAGEHSVALAEVIRTAVRQAEIKEGLNQ